MHVPVLLVSLMYVRITLRVNYTCISPIRKYTNDCKFKETIKSFDRTYIWEFPELNTSTANPSVMSGQSCISIFILGTSYQDLMLFTSYHCECISTKQCHWWYPSLIHKPLFSTKYVIFITL